MVKLTRTLILQLIKNNVKVKSEFLKHLTVKLEFVPKFLRTL